MISTIQQFRNNLLPVITTIIQTPFLPETAISVWEYMSSWQFPINSSLSGLNGKKATYLSTGPLSWFIRRFGANNPFTNNDARPFFYAIKDRGGTGFHDLCFDYVSRYINVSTSTHPVSLLDKGYEVAEDPQAGDVVFYFFDEEQKPSGFTHVGLVTDANPFQVWVESKWGKLNIHEHLVSLVPYQYGNAVVYLRKKSEP